MWPSFRILINVCVCGGGCYRGALQREQMAAREKNGLRRKEAAAGGALIVSPELYILIMTNVFAGVGRLSLRLIYCTLPIFFQRRTKKGAQIPIYSGQINRP